MAFLSKGDVENIEKNINYHFKNAELLSTAFTHSSFANLHNIESNERLEFLGDSILSFVVSEKLYKNCKRDEGKLSHLRAQLVSAQNLSDIIDKLGLATIYSKYAISAMTINVKGDLFESLLCAIYLDGGLAPAKKFVIDNIDLTKQAIACENEKIVDYKSPLQEYLQGKGITNFAYKTLEQSGPPHNPTFEVALFINGEQFCSSQGGSKQKAEQLCARLALELLNKNIHL